jgi:hypothetical protein
VENHLPIASSIFQVAKLLHQNTNHPMPIQLLEFQVQDKWQIHTTSLPANMENIFIACRSAPLLSTRA